MVKKLIKLDGLNGLPLKLHKRLENPEMIFLTKKPVSSILDAGKYAKVKSTNPYGRFFLSNDTRMSFYFGELEKNNI